MLNGIRFAAACAALMLAGGTAHAANQVLVVSAVPGPGIDFSHLQDAIDAASDGDIILVRSADSLPALATIDGKSLSVLGDPATSGVLVTVPPIRVLHLAPTQKVVLRGLLLANGAGMGQGAQLAIQGCEGPVFVEACSVATFSFIPLAFLPAVLIVNSSHVVLTLCAGNGVPGITGSGAHPPAAGLVAQNSAVTAYNCKFRGGAGALAMNGAPGALVLGSGSLFAAGGEYTGGAGGPGTFAALGCVASGNGGAGILASGNSLTQLAVTAIGGLAGVDPPGCSQVGVAGLPVEVLTGSSGLVAESLRTLDISSPIHEGQPVTVTVKGTPGEPAQLLQSLAPYGLPVLAWKGTLAGAFPLTPIVLGIIPPSGEISFTATVPVGSLPAGIDGLEIYEQVLVPGSSNAGLLGTPSITAIVR